MKRTESKPGTQTDSLVKKDLGLIQCFTSVFWRSLRSKRERFYDRVDIQSFWAATKSQRLCVAVLMLGSFTLDASACYTLYVIGSAAIEWMSPDSSEDKQTLSAGRSKDTSDNSTTSEENGNNTTFIATTALPFELTEVQVAKEAPLLINYIPTLSYIYDHFVQSEMTPKIAQLGQVICNRKGGYLLSGKVDYRSIGRILPPPAHLPDEFSSNGSTMAAAVLVDWAENTLCNQESVDFSEKYIAPDMTKTTNDSFCDFLYVNEQADWLKQAFGKEQCNG